MKRLGSRALNGIWLAFGDLRDMNMPEDVFLVDQLLVPEGKLLLIGGPKKGKSLLAQQLIHTAAAVGLPGAPTNWLGFKVPRPLRVMYVQYEVTVRMMQERIRRQSEGLGYEFVIPPYVLNRPPRDVPLRDLITQGVQGAGAPPDLVVIDPLTQVHLLDENNAQEMRRLTDSFDAIIDEFGCAMVVVHHARKDYGQGKGLEQARGSIQLTAWPNTIITMNDKGKAGKELTFDLRDGERPDPMVIELNPKTLTFTPTGKIALTREYVEQRLEDEWAGYSRAQLVKAIMRETGLAQATVYKKLHELGLDSFF